MSIPRLGSMIVHESHDKIEVYLSPLGQDQDSQKLSEELAFRNENGMTPLHIAVKRGDIRIVEVLLSFDASIEAKIGDANVEDYARELAQSNPNEEFRKKIYALIKSRGRWQLASSKGQGILFSRAFRAIEHTMNKIQGASNKTGVLALGITGEGKSTLINYQTGVDYKKKRVKGLTTIDPNPVNSFEVVKRGGTPNSETLYPQVVPLEGNPYVLVDLPGFEDTRGSAEEICAAAGIKLLTKDLKSIQTIFLVCSWNSLEDARMISYRKAAHNIGAIISTNPSTAENVVFVVTKPPEDLEIEDVVARLDELKDSEGWTTTSASAPINREDANSDDWKKDCLKRVTQALLLNPKNIILVDVTKPAGRKEISRLIDSLECKAKNPNFFEFTNSNRYMEQFGLVIEGMIVNYNDLERKRKVNEEKISQIRLSITQVEEEEQGLSKSIRDAEEQMKKPFTEESFNDKITAEKKKRSDYRQLSLDQRRNIEKAHLAKKVAEMQLSSLDQNGTDKLIDIVRQDWICEKTEDRTETKVTYGRQIFVPGMGQMQLVDIKEEVIKGTEKTVSEAVNYHSTIPIKRFLDRSQGGTFEAQSFSSGDMKISGLFRSMIGAKGSVFLSVEVYGDIKDFPETKEKRNQIESNLKIAESDLALATKSSISDEDLESCEERIREMELKKIRAVGSHENTKALCEIEIKYLLAEQVKAREKLQGLHHLIQKEEEELEDLTLQIDVNKDLFVKIRGMIDRLEFNGEVFARFREFLV